MAAVVYAAVQWGGAWKGRLVIAITDSNNALCWLRNRYCRNAFGSYLLRLLSLLEMRHGFDLWPVRVDSESNTLPDCACRYWGEGRRAGGPSPSDPVGEVGVTLRRPPIAGGRAISRFR